MTEAWLELDQSSHLHIVLAVNREDMIKVMGVQHWATWYRRRQEQFLCCRKEPHQNCFV